MRKLSKKFACVSVKRFQTVCAVTIYYIYYTYMHFFDNSDINYEVCIIIHKIGIIVVAIYQL